MHRRGFLAAVGATVVAPRSALAAKPDPLDADMLAALEDQLVGFDGARVLGTRLAGDESSAATGNGYWKDVPELDAGIAATLASGTRYWDLPAEERIPARWVAPAAHPDTFHLGDVAGEGELEVDAALLRGLCEANAFVLGDGTRLFGLRGASLVTGTDSDWGLRHTVALTAPDHVHRRCVIGVWGADDRIRLFSGSTVPQIGNMAASVPVKGWTCSLLPAGRYRFQTGTHAASTDRPQPGALRHVGEYVVLRATLPADGALAYDPAIPYNVWNEGRFHNVHAAGTGEVFNSSGCQVVRGGYNKGRTEGTGEWRAFQIAAGLAQADGTPGADGRDFDYFVLPAVEARLYASDAAFRRDYRRLRPGSEGERVQRMREALAPLHPKVVGQDVPAPGPVFDLMTSFLVLEAVRADRGERLGPVWVG